MDGKNTSTAEQTTSQQQVGAQGGGAGSSTLVAGANTANANVQANNQGLLTGKLGAGATQTISVMTSDPEALAANAAVSEAAITQVGDTAHDALAANAAASGEEENVAFASEALSAQALQSANQQQAQNAGDIESLSEEFAAGLSQATANDQVTANNAATGLQEGIDPYGVTAPSTGLSKWATIFTIGAALVAIIAFFKSRGKST